MSALAVTLTVDQLADLVRVAVREGFARAHAKPVLTLEEASKLLGWSPATVMRLTQEAGLSVRYIDAKSPRFFRRDLDAPLPLETQALAPGVYAVRSGDHVKIGRATVRVIDRVRSLQTAHHEQLELLSILSRDPDDERPIHAELAQFRVRCEWFALTDACREAMASISMRIRTRRAAA